MSRATLLAILVLASPTACADHLTWYYSPDDYEPPVWWSWRTGGESIIQVKGDLALESVGGYNSAVVQLHDLGGNETRWHTDLGASMAMMSWNDGLILFGRADPEALSMADQHRDGRLVPGTIVILDESSGQTVARHAVPHMPDEATLGNGLVFVILNNWYHQSDPVQLRAHRLDDWTLVWELGKQSTTSGIPLVQGVPAPEPYNQFGRTLRLAPSGSTLTYASYDWLVGLQAQTGALRWETQCPQTVFAITTVGFADGILYPLCDGVYAVDSETGSPVWPGKLGSSHFGSQPAVVIDDDVLYRGSDDSLWRISTDGSSVQQLDVSGLAIDHNSGLWPGDLPRTVALWVRDEAHPGMPIGRIVVYDLANASVAWDGAVVGPIATFRISSGLLIESGIPGPGLGHHEQVVRAKHGRDDLPQVAVNVTVEPTPFGARLHVEGRQLAGRPVVSWHYSYLQGDFAVGPTGTGPSAVLHAGEGFGRVVVLASDADGRLAKAETFVEVHGLPETPSTRQSPAAPLAALALILLGLAACHRLRNAGAA